MLNINSILNPLDIEEKALNKRNFSKWCTTAYLFPLLVLLIVISSILSPFFLTKENIVDIMNSNVTMAILALGMFFVIVTGGIDLSVGSTVAFSGCLVAGLLDGGMSWGLAVIIALLLCMVAGTISGITIAYGKVPPFIATLAMMTILRGAAYMYQVGSPKTIMDNNIIAINDQVFLNGWLPLPFFILIVIILMAWFTLSHTPFGRRLYAIGDNIEAAHYTGIKVPFLTMSVYTINGLLSGIAGIILASKLMIGSALVGSGYEMDAIASVILGGASFSGGSGSALATILGAYTFGFIANILNLMNIGGYPQMIIKGGIILVALLAVGRKK
jgi:ribose transport system permease protein